MKSTVAKKGTHWHSFELVQKPRQKTIWWAPSKALENISSEKASTLLFTERTLEKKEERRKGSDIMALEKLDKTTYGQKVLNIPGKACVEFYADWCGWCKRQEKVSEQVVESGRSDVPIYMLNGDEHPDIAEEMGIRGYPTYILFEAGKKKAALVGAHPASEVEAFLES